MTPDIRSLFRSRIQLPRVDIESRIARGEVARTNGPDSVVSRHSFGRSTTRRLLSFFLIGLGVGLNAFPQVPTPPARTNEFIVENFHGTVEIRRNLEDAPTPVLETGTPLGSKDRIQTQVRSDATIVNASAGVGLDQSTRVTVSGPRELRAESGRVFFKSLGEVRDDGLVVLLPGGKALAHGTEFAIQISTNGESSLTVLSGSVTLTNFSGGSPLTVDALQEASMGSNSPPHLTSRLEVGSMGHVIQWMLYYPGVLSLNDLGPAVTNTVEIQDSVKAYRLGNLPAALRHYPENRVPASGPEIVFQAALLLSSGDVEASWQVLNRLPGSTPADSIEARLAASLRQVIAVVTGATNTYVQNPKLASEWLAESYWRQARGGRDRLQDSLVAATNALSLDPGFGFAWVQRAELEFGFRHNARARTSIERGLDLVPEDAQAHTVRGFLLAGENNLKDAAAEFDRAIALDPGLGNAWLGSGLVRIRTGNIPGGLQDLQVAVTQEPNRSLLRSYLGKAYQVAGNPRRAREELETAIQWDPKDPTPRLYAALVDAQQNRINEAVRELEAAQLQVDNRAVFRSGHLLDEDRSVQSANLASIYRDAGMVDVGVREASRAVSYDYANAAAHLFLADSYDNLRDPRGITLRYETPWQNELLLANLLSPAAAGAFSQNVSQQDYSRLFQSDYAGVFSQSAYLGNDSWSQAFSQFGIFGNSSYSVDVNYYDLQGWRPNEDTSNLSITTKFKQQITRQDTLFLEMIYSRVESGDLIQYYNPTNYSPVAQIRESQVPITMAGWHREWNPQNHTLFLALRAEDTYHWTNSPVGIPTYPEYQGVLYPPSTNGYGLNYQGQLVLYSAEAQHILLSSDGRFTGIFGGRYQGGTVNTDQVLNDFLFDPESGSFGSQIERASAYAYGTAEPVDSLQLTAGVSYDHLMYPVNFRTPPLSNAEATTGLWSPKGGFIWTPGPVTHVRAAYAQTLGGAAFDQSFRLEPNSVAGFVQSYRSLIPESVVGSTAAAVTESWSASLDHRFPTGTYLGITGEWLDSEAPISSGAYVQDNDDFPSPPPQTAVQEGQARFRERNVWLTLNQLLGDHWSAGAVYRWSNATLDQQISQLTEVNTGARYTAIPVPAAQQEAVLQALDLSVVFNHPCGAFARAGGVWFHQFNETPSLPGDAFWQCNLLFGWRFLDRRLEVTAGALNLNDQNYQLNPLNLYPYLPRGRVFTGQLKLNF